MFGSLFIPCKVVFLYYDSFMPNYEGQRQKGLCPITGKAVRWIAKYHPDGDLRWWCACGKTVAVEKAIVSRKKVVS